MSGDFLLEYNKIYNNMTQYFTKEGLEKLKKELDYLENTKRREVAEKLSHAISFGDLRENAAYDEAKEEQGFVERKILDLKKTLAQAEITSDFGMGSQEKNGTVQIGSKVVLDCDGCKEEFQIVGPQEADIVQKKISHQSPLGKALLGKSAGEKAIIQITENKVEYEILAVR